MSTCRPRKTAMKLARILEGDVRPVSDLLTMLERGEAFAEICIFPKGGDFPRANVSFHRGYGYVLQCFEHERSVGDFLVSGEVSAAPVVPIELGGQALERWPRELFVSETLVFEALERFCDSAKEKNTLRWIGNEEFARATIWEGREERDAWERSRGIDDKSDA